MAIFNSYVKLPEGTIIIIIPLCLSFFLYFVLFIHL